MIQFKLLLVEFYLHYIPNRDIKAIYKFTSDTSFLEL